MKSYFNKLIFSTLIIIYGYLNAQSASIKGTVVDSLSGNTLIGANVILEGTSLGMATDNEGRYNIPNVNPGRYTIKVSYIGYEPSSKEIDISDGGENEINFNLSAKISQVIGE